MIVGTLVDKFIKIELIESRLFVVLVDKNKTNQLLRAANNLREEALFLCRTILIAHMRRRANLLVADTTSAQRLRRPAVSEASSHHTRSSLARRDHGVSLADVDALESDLFANSRQLVDVILRLLAKSRGRDARGVLEGADALVAQSDLLLQVPTNTRNR